MEAKLLDLLSARRGHFHLESGHHGDLWLDLDSLFLEPRGLLPFTAELARRLAGYRIELVVGPLVGGALVAQTVAAELGARFAFAERVPTTQGIDYLIPPTFRHALEGKRVAIVDDAINAGSATRATHAALQRAAAKPVAVGALLVLGTASLAFFEDNHLPLERIADLPNTIWRSADCPLCAAGVPLSNPQASP